MASDPKAPSSNASNAHGLGTNGVSRVPADDSAAAISTLPPPVASRPGAAIAPPPIVRPPPCAAPKPTLEPADEEPGEPLSWRQRFERLWKQASSCLTSLAVHAALIILLGLFAASQEIKHGLSGFVALNSGQAEPRVSNLDASQAEARLQSDSITDNHLAETAAELSKSIKAQGASPSPRSPSLGAAVAAMTDVGELLAGGGDLFGAYDADAVGSLGGRGKAERAKWLAEGGGTKQSEDAVERGLRWLQAHQNPDGSWLFDFEQGPCRGKCGDSGRYASPIPSTALALLAFLGHGETQREGEYQDTVKKGLYYLCGKMSISENGGSLMESDGKGMYSHGLSAIAICEAYAMTREKELENYAQHAIDFIVSAQDKRGGGWRYTPGMPGDTTVSGWQIMALKSGQMAYLRVPQDTIHRATKFLDSVESKQGAQYQYQPRVKEGKELTTTSVGLLCRLYTGWPLDHPGIPEGVQTLSRNGPSPNNMYFDYYATQVLHQWGGPEWQEWNYRMRDYLVRTQANAGHESGSWNFNGSWTSEGGRLYNTALAIMILEVYYRHLPLYGPNAINQ